MYVKTCKYCGREFESPTPGKQCCNGPHYKTCEICGKEFVVPQNRLYDKTLTCCSKGCSSVKRSRAIKAAKSGKSVKRQNVKTCKYCGRKFVADGIHKVYCSGPHFAICKQCGKKFDITEYFEKHKKAPNFCSKECGRAHANQTIAEKQKDESYEAQKLQKRRQTVLRKYGVDNVSKSEEVKSKIKKSLNDKYGVDNPAKLPQAQKALAEYRKSQDAIKLANAKREETNLQKFGSKYFTQSVDSHLLQGFDQVHADRVASFYKNCESFVKENFDHKPTVKELSEFLRTSWPINELRIELQSKNLVRYNASSMEQEVLAEIKNLGAKVEVVRNDRTQIAPLELDFYFPTYNFAIECNPTATHNSSFGIYDCQPLSSSYHQTKTEMCEKAGIFLLHIFGYQWDYERPQVLSIIRNKLGKNEYRVFARKCEVVDVDSVKAREFLSENHLQGYATSSVRLGLEFEGSLVSLMTFTKRKNSSCNWELTRFCSKQETNVTGGASKLFSSFVKTYKPEQVVTYSNRAYASGNLYDTLGFKQKSKSKPDYVWVDRKTNKAYNRISAQKKNLKKLLHDDSIDLSKTEKQIMEEHNFAQVFGSGTVTWVWSR